MGSWRGGGVGIDPGERVVVAMLLPSLDHFLDLLEGPAEPLPVRAPEPFAASNVSMLGHPFLWEALCLKASNTSQARGQS